MTIKRIQSIAITLCGLFTSAIIILAVIHFKDFVEHQRVWEAKRKELVALKEEIVKIKKSLDLYEREKLDFQKYLFREQDVPAFIDGISQFAQKALVNIKDMKTGRFEEVVIAEKSATAKSDSGKNQKDEVTQRKERLDRALTLAAMPIRVQMDGLYSSIVEFLGHLEGFDQLVTITDVGISSGMGSEYPTLKCEFTLKIYSLKTLEELQNR